MSETAQATSGIKGRREAQPQENDQLNEQETDCNHAAIMF
jgi:hypothetical protein